jgi:hypothetical protein
VHSLKEMMTVQETFFLDLKAARVPCCCLKKKNS